MTKSLLADFKSTLKDLEDALDLVFNRFPAYLIVRAAAPFRITPNALTGISFFMTCIACWLIVRRQFALSALFIYLKVVFDCSDGQMARYTNTTTRFGRLYDELADISGQFLLFGAIGYTMMRTGFRWPVFLGLCASLFFVGADITLFQNFRTYYVRIYERRKSPAAPSRRKLFIAIDGLDALREATFRLIPLPDINAFMDKNGWSGEQVERLRAAFRRRFRPMVYVFSLFSGTSHLFAIAILALLHKLGGIIPLFILWYNVFLAAAIAVQVANVVAFKRRYMAVPSP